MFILNSIISGGPGLFFVVVLWTLFCTSHQINLHTLWSRFCRLFFEQRENPLLKQYSKAKGQLFDSPTGLSLLSTFYPPGLTPVIKSNRPEFRALLSGSAKKAGFLLGIFVLLSIAHIQAATIISTGTGGNWSAASTWIGGVVPESGDNVSIPDGSTVTIDANPIVGSLSVSGVLQFEVTTARSITVLTQVTVNSGGVFRSAQSGTVKNHQLIVQGSVINDGKIDFSSNSNATGVEIVFTGSNNAIFNCSDAPLTNLKQTNGLILNKGTSAASVLSFIPGNTFQVLSDGGSNARGFLSVINGTFNIIGSNRFNNPVFNTEGDYTIPATGGFWLGNQNATVIGMNGTVTNLGELKITNGNYNVGISGGSSLETLADGQFKMSGGTLTVAGDFKMDGGNASISGGRINLATQANSADQLPTLSMSGRTTLELYGTPVITIAYPNSRTVPVNDIQIGLGGGRKSVTGGAIQLGTEATPAGSSFFVNGDPILNRLTVLNECTIQIFNTSKSDLAVTPIGSLPLIAFDKTAPTLTAPTKITLKCGDQIPLVYSTLQEFLGAGGAASDNCALLPATFKLAKQVQSNASCPYTITRTYEVKDNSGNAGTAEHVIVVEGEGPQPKAVAEKVSTEELKLKSAMATFTAVQTGNWNDPATWSSTVTPSSTDNVIIPGPYTVTVNSAASCDNITIDAGATLKFSGTNTLQVNGNLLNNGTISSVGATGKILLYGNWTNNGTYNGDTDGIVEFTGTNPTSIAGSSTTTFKQFIVNKGALADVVQVASNIQLNGDIVFTRGTLQVNAGVTVNCTHNSGFIIEQPAGLKILGTFNSGAFSIDNKGVFEVAGGTANLGTAVGNSLTIMNTGDFTLSSGQINIAGRLELSGGDAVISGGTLNINTVGNNSASPSFYLSPTSTLNMSGGNIVFQKPNGTGNLDMFIESGSKNFDAGNITFGGIAGTYRISSEINPFPSTINAAAGTNLILKMFVSTNTTYNFPLVTSVGNSIPAIINLTSGAVAGASIQIETIGSKHSNNANTTNYLNRYWKVSTLGFTGGLAYDMTTTYADGDIVGNEANIVAGLYSSGWTKSNQANSGANTITAGGLNGNIEITGIRLEPPTVSITATNSTICIGTSTTLTANPIGDAPFSYVWSPSTGLSSTSATSTTANPTVTTNYMVTVTDGNGFTATTVITITVTEIPTATISYVGAPFCKSLATAQNVTLNGTGAYTGGTFTALPGGLTINASTGAITPSTSTANTYTVTYTIPASGGCAAVPVTATVTVTEIPTATISYAGAPFCKSLATAQTVNLTGTGAYTGGTFTSSPGGLTIDASTGAITPGTSTANTYTVTYTIPASGGCAAVPATATITVNPLPIPTITPVSPTVCAGSTGNIYFTEAGMSAYVWTVSAGGSIASGAVTNSITVTWNTPGPQLVTVSYTNANGCAASTATIYNFTVNSKPSFTITNPADVCSPITIDLTSPSIKSDPTLTYTYFTDAVGTITLNNPSTVSVTGTYYIKGTTASGCSDIKAVSVTINPTPTVVITNPAAVCSPATVDLSAAAVTAGSTSGITFTYWTNAAATNPLANYSTVSVTGTYYIKGATSSCYDIKPVVVTVNQAPVGTNTSTTICSGQILNFNLAATVTASSTFTWTVVPISGTVTVTGATSTSGGTLSQTLTSSGNGGTVVYRVTPTSIANGCFGAAYSVTVTVNTLPTVTTTETEVIACERSFVSFTASAIGSPNPTNVQWQISTGTGNPWTWTDLVNGGAINGATTNALLYNIPNNAPTPRYYRAVYTNSCGSTASNYIKLISDKGPQLNTDMPGTINGCAGGTITFTAKVTGAGAGNKPENRIDGIIQYLDGSTWVDIPSSSKSDNSGQLDYSFSIAISNYPYGTTFRIAFTGKCGSVSSSTRVIYPTSVVTAPNGCVGSTIILSQDGDPLGTWTIRNAVTSAVVYTLANAPGQTLNYMPNAVGCYSATYSTGSCTDTKAFVVFPALPTLPFVTSSCGSTVSITTIPTYSGFNAEYAVQAPSGVMSAWGTFAQAQTLLSNTGGCWTFKARYALAANCGTTLAGSTTTATGCSEAIFNAFVFPSKPVLTAPFNTCASAFALPSVPAISGFNVEYGIDTATFTTTPVIPTTPGCHTIKARYVVAAACGTVPAGTSGGVACESDPVSVVIFPPSPPVPTVSAGCGAFTVTAPPAIAGFNIEYSFNNGFTWGVSNASPAGETCAGYDVKTRYSLASACGSTSATTVGSLPSCGESPSVNRKVDNTAPTVTCNSAPAPVCPNPGSTYVHSGTSWDATVTDNCAAPTAFASLSGTTTGTNLTTLNNVAFNIGTTIVTWTASDGCNTSTCSFSVTVNPKPSISAITAPAICSGGTFTVTPVNGTNGTVPAGTTYTWAAPFIAGITGATASTSATSISGTLNNTTAAAITVNYTVTPTSGAGCIGNAFTVTVTVNPILTCSISGSAGPLCPSSTGNIYTAPVGMSIYSWSINGNGTIVGATNSSSVSVTAGAVCNASFLLTLNYNDLSGCTSSCSQIVTVVDITKPSITCPAAVNTVTNSGECIAAPVALGTPTVTDNCGGTVTLTNDAPTEFTVGTTTVIWTATDACGNVNTCAQTVTVIDNQAGTLTCIPSFQWPADDNELFALNVPIPKPPLTGPSYTYTDNCGTYTLTWTLSGATTSNSASTGINEIPSSYPRLNVGDNIFTYTVTDAGNNSTSCAFTVNVYSAPEIECQPGIVTDTSTNSCTSTFDPGVPDLIQGQPDITWTWTIDSPISAPVTGTVVTTVAKQSPPSIGLINFDHGTTTITWTATNLAGTTSCTQIITVNDVTQPIYTPSPQPIEECVENLFSATYAVADPNVVKINPDPDYYLLRNGTASGTLDLDLISYLKDNCCPDVGTMTWTITFTAVPGNPSTPGTIGPEYGQPSTYEVGGVPTDIKLWGDGVTFQPVTHTISYTVYDCHGNHSTFDRQITINPRPELIKMP